MRFLRNNPFAILLILYMAYQSITSGQVESPTSWIMDKLIMLPAILIGLSFHEFAHAFAADRLGDNTPRVQGRVTINPFAHVDPFGLLALIFIGFGWGKPVQVNPRNFKRLRRDSLIVDLAGVTVNLILALAFAGILWLIYTSQTAFMNTYMGGVVVEIFVKIIQINVILMIFNLLPIPPLDGFGVITEIFNLRRYPAYYRIYENGFMILMVLLIFNIIDKVLNPAVQLVLNIIFGTLFGY